MRRIFVASAIMLVAAFSTLAQSSGSIRGVVTSQVNSQPLAGVAVQIPQLRLSTQTDDAGVYEFIGVPAGRHSVITHFEGFSDQARTIVVSTAPITVDFALSITAINEQVTVTATGTEESVFESFQSVNSVGGTRIKEQASTSVGEILERESGVGKRSFGPGTSRPVIRGFDGDRVLVLQDGARTGSVGSQSGDHGEPIDTLHLERLEVIKGPATLLYGSNAIGGVVNAVSSDEDDPHQGLRGSFTALGATNNRQGGTAGGLEYGYKKILFNGNVSFLREGDYQTPLGRVPNSASRSFGGGLSVGYFAKKGFLIGSLNFDRRRYGIPYAPLFESGELLTDEDGNPCEPTKEETPNGKGAVCQYDIFGIQERFARTLPDVPGESIDIRMRRQNFRVRGGFRDVSGPIAAGNFSIDYTDYQHEEIETIGSVADVATTFTNDTFSYRAMLQQANYKGLSGRFGFEGFNRNYLTVGAEQLIDGRVRQNNVAVFGLEEITLDRVAFQFGARVEHNRYNPENRTAYNARSFTGLSVAAAARIRLWEGSSFIANFTSAYRAPALEELYNEGAHIGTVTFEIGNEALERERSNGIELSLRQQLKRLRINGSVFYYNIDNFVFISPQDADGDGLIDVEDNLPIGRFGQGKARFVGADLSADADLTDWLGIFAKADTVNAEIKQGNTPLPRITPSRLRTGVDFKYKGLSVRPEAVFTGARKRDDVFTLETPTTGYSLFNVNASYTFAAKQTVHTFSVSSSNLGDRLYRNHLSFIKDLAPEPGRGFRFSYTIRLF
ncbi:MAG: TonB-dependent receptor [Blastocatellia bacterium]|nr:TonB-dependent receptor [Blastocatellia bacterium]